MIKNIIVVIGIILAILGIIFGAFLPLAKAKSYIGAFSRLQSVKTLEEFKRTFDAPLNFYSPVGQEEVVRFLANEILGKMIYAGQKEEISRELVLYIEPRVSSNNSKHLLILAMMYGRMFEIYGNGEYLEKAQENFQRMLVLNPKSPQALHSLFGIYLRKGEFGKAKEIGGIILQYWPEEENIKKILESIEVQKQTL